MKFGDDEGTAKPRILKPRRSVGLVQSFFLQQGWRVYRVRVLYRDDIWGYYPKKASQRNKKIVNEMKTVPCGREQACRVGLHWYTVLQIARTRITVCEDALEAI